MAAQDAELQLKVSLDLAFFRQQLSGLGQAAAGYNVFINVKFDRRSVQNELNALGRNISQRTYRLEVATNISQEIKNAGTLAKALRGLDNAIQKNRGIANRAAGGSSAGAAGVVNAANIETLVKKSTKPALEALYSEMSKAKIPMTGVGKGTVDELRKSIVSGVPGITQDIAKGLANGLNPELKENGTKGARVFIDAFKAAAGIASPSKVFKALGEFSADGLEIGFMNGLKDFKAKAIGEIRQIVALMKLELASVGDVRIGPGTGVARAGARGGSQYMNPIGPLPTGSREPWAFSQYRYQPFMAQPGQVRGAGVPPMRARQPFLPAPPVMGTTSSPGMLGQARLALPAAGETSARAMREAALALRELAARQRSDARSASVMGENRMWSRVAGQVPVGAGGPFLPPGAGGGVPPRPPSGGGGGGMGSFSRALGGVNLPGTGVVREIGNEFAMATKQVLLFGTAYKGLAFLTSFPAQVGQAVGALQSFNNTLKAISPTAQEAKTSNQFILDIVDRYNVPLQSARDGFTKLYASMAPAGFKGDEIRALFTGVSQAAATFGMSSEKVDRVNYAFAQMASKGQVMSEELKGQLGDVLPGAMGIFAEAAGFKGPQAIEKFSKALEDGAYKGDAMRALLKNVTGVLQKEFGPGAEGAARTFQGVINRMQNSTKLLYEAFEPVAVGFLNGVVVPLTSGLKTVADGVNAFLKNTQAKTSGGFALAQELERLRPAFDGIRTNIANLLPVFQAFGQLALSVARILLQLAGNPVVGYLAKIYAIALPLNMALGVMRGLWAANALQLIIFNARVATGTSTLTAFRGMMAATGATAATTAASIRGAGLVLRTFFAATGVGLVITGISMLVERFMSMNQALEDTKNKALGAAQAIRSMSSTEARAAQFSAQNTVKELQNLQQSGNLRRKGKDIHVAVPSNLVKKLESAGVPVQRDLIGQATVERSMLDAYIQQQSGIIAEAGYRQRQLQYEEQQAAAATAVTPMPEGAAGKGAGTKLDTYNRSQLDFIRQNAEQEKLALERRLQQKLISQTQYDISLAELDLETKKLELAEQLRLSKLEINKDNLSSQDKLLKLTDAQTAYQNELNIAQDKYTVAVEGARKELEGPLEEALQRTNAAMSEQRMLLGNLKIGLGDLTPDQKAYLQVQELITGKTEDELKILEGKIAILRRVFEQQILLNKEVEKEKKLRELSQSIEMAGALTPDAELRQKLSQEGYTGADLEVRFGLEKILQRAQELKGQLQGIASSIGDSFGQAFKGIITGSSSVQEALAGMFRSIADSFADMVSQMIASWIRTQVLQGFQNLFGPAMGALGSFGGGASIGQAVSMPTGAGIGAGGGILQNSMGQGFGTFGPNFGIRQFANGGIVSGPTLGLVGEGRYNEAVIPLPDGKSVPVDLGGASGSNISTNIVVNMGNGQGGGGQASGAQGNQLARELEGAVRQVILKESRPGGIIYSR